MLTKKSVLLGLALVFLVMPALVLAGEGEQEGPLDFQIDVSQLGEPCKYWAPSPPNGELPGAPRLHTGLQTEVLVPSLWTVDVQLACTDQPTCEHAEATLDCFLTGEHYIRLQVDSPTAGCVWFTLKGLRGAATSIRIDSVKQPLRYLSTLTDGVNMVCGLQGEQVLEMRMMMCPDVAGDHVVTEFFELMDLLALYGLEEGDPGWDYRYDHNEDGRIDLYGDVFPVLYRFGLKCDEFDY